MKIYQRIGRVMKNGIINKIKLWIYLHKDNISSFFKLLIPILLLIFLIRNIPLIIRSYSLSKLNSETIGVVDSIERIKGIHESETGGRIVIKNYVIDYHYQIGNKKIQQKEVINRNGITLKQRIKLNKMEKGDSIQIKYNSEKLEESKIEIK